MSSPLTPVMSGTNCRPAIVVSSLCLEVAADLRGFSVTLGELLRRVGDDLVAEPTAPVPQRQVLARRAVPPEAESRRTPR